MNRSLKVMIFQLAMFNNQRVNHAYGFPFEVWIVIEQIVIWVRDGKGTLAG